MLQNKKLIDLGILLLVIGCIYFVLTNNPESPITSSQSVTTNSGISEADKVKNSSQKVTKDTCKQKLNLQFIRTNNQGQTTKAGENYVLMFDPKSKELDFKVSLGLAHPIYEQDAEGEFSRKYVPKPFHQIISDENAKLNGKKPIAAINGDYIDLFNNPQGLNFSRGIEYSGEFKDKRSSFAISGNVPPDQRVATIQKGKRSSSVLNFNVVGGNGRFYQNGKFKNICQELGDYACKQEASRSMVAITDKGYVIMLVNNLEGKVLYPDNFDDVLKGIAQNNCLGNIREGMLFDGGYSTGFYYDNKIYAENFNPIGSVFLIYKTK